MFNWLCPDCSIDHYYSGSQTTRATTNCPKTKKKFKVFQYKVVVEKKEDSMIAKARLHPPLEVETSVSGDFHVKTSSARVREARHITDSSTSEMDIDFNSIARSSDFQRFIIFLAKKITPGIFSGVSTRKSSTVMKQQFNQKRADFSAVMIEMKEVLRKRNENV